MKLTKYLGMVLLAGTLTACGDDFLEPQYSGYATSEEIAGAAQDDPQGVLGSQLDGVYAIPRKYIQDFLVYIVGACRATNRVNESTFDIFPRDLEKRYH